MAKWADHLISKVRFNDADTHIVKVEVREDKGDKVGAAEEMTRQHVIDMIDDGYSFATIYQDNDNNWKFGAHVKIVTIEGTRYIKTYADGTKKDNLDNLPRF